MPKTPYIACLTETAMHLLDFIVAMMATASVEASIDPKRAAYCQVQPLSCSWNIYSMMGIMMAQLPATTRKANMMTGAATCMHTCMICQ